MDTSDYYTIAGVLFITALGGVVAYFKRDYVTRGMAICFFTNLWGMLAMILSPASMARTQDEYDEHHWPQLSWLAVSGTVLTVLTVMLARWLFSS
jgi:hypothetical protein